MDPSLWTYDQSSDPTTITCPDASTLLSKEILLVAKSHGRRWQASMITSLIADACLIDWLHNAVELMRGMHSIQDEAKYFVPTVSSYTPLGYASS